MSVSPLSPASCLQDLLVYGHAYKHEVSEHVTEENMVHTDPDNPPTYISKAYFER